MLIRECAPLCLTLDSGWGRVSRGWAWIAAANTMLPRAGGVKAFGERKVLAGVGPLQLTDVKLFHFEHGVHDSSGFFRIGVIDQLRQNTGNDLP